MGNHRDASNGSGPWKRPPTEISVPGSNVHGRNPYSGSRMQDTLTAPKSTRGLLPTGNRTAMKTAISSSTKGKGKSLENMHSKYFTSSNEPEGTNRGKMLDFDSKEITEVDSSEPLPRAHERSTSEDPIDMLGKPDSSRSTSSSRPSHASATRGSRIRALPLDGQATLRLKEKHGQRVNPPTTIDLSRDEDNDSIQSASGFDDLPALPVKRSSPRVNAGTVSRIVSQYEEKSKPHTSLPSKPLSSQVSLDTDNVRRIDLTLKQGVKAAMKPRKESHPVASTSSSTSHPDALSITSNFVHEPKRIPKAKRAAESREQAPIMLPLSQWAMGCEIFGEEADAVTAQYWLQYDSGKRVLTVRDKSTNGKDVRRFPLDSTLQGFKYTDLHRGSPDTVILRVDTQKRMPPQRPQPRHFEPGSSGIDGKLVFKFPPRHANLNDDSYDRLVTEWKGLVKDGGRQECIDGHAAENLWKLTLDSTNEAYVQFWERPHAERTVTAQPEDANETETIPESSRPILAIANTVAGPSTRTRAKRAAADNATRTPPLDPDELLLVYPPSGTGAVNLTRADIQRLEPGQYLNDNIIEFALKLWHNDFREKEPGLAEQVHIFNSFFYKKMHVKSKEDGYKSVRKWTSKFDLFKKKYIIVPINEHMHWYLAIICNPEYILKPPPPEPPKVVSQVQTRKRKREEHGLPDDSVPGIPSAASSPPVEERASSPRPRSGSEGAVEALLGTSATTQGNPTATTSPTATDSDNNIPDLQYPLSEAMDVDDPASIHSETRAMDVDEASTSGEPSTSCRASSPLSDPPTENGDVYMMTTSTANGDPIVIDDTEEPRSTAVPPSRFYGSVKGKERARSEASANAEIEAQIRLELEMEHTSLDQEETVDAPPESTYIFTFDSLGSKHPGAVTTLREYLKLEAKDKKGLDPAETSNAVGKTALVPGQPNYCDCGVYLIHFVQVFMKDPVRLSEIIMAKKPREYASKEREQDWEADTVAGLRENLYDRIMELSAKWKDSRPSKGKEKEVQLKDIADTATTGPSTRAVSVVVDEDDEEIEIGEIISKAPAKKGNAKTKAAQALGKDSETRATRIR
ncbi:hypothetical protein NM688_g7926 [Phlebia brevispora]|uniref:Uncharacterized protein n=1 Tax=Phlebia brevispora TaxID=194682 RepID=A0ACC1RZN8_9APHY|nr:hypothetical protein NM688_g7926 [Phlebia brevispora]